MKKTGGYLWLLIIIFVLALAGQHFFLTNKFTANKEETIVKIRTLSKNTSQYQISGEYPLFGSLAPKLDSKIDSLISKKMADFKKEAKENAEIRGKDAPLYYLTFSWSPTQINNNIISFLIRTEAFSGGANPDELIDTFNYNVTKQKLVSLKDLFPAEDNYLQQVSQYTQDALESELEEEVGPEWPNLKSMFTEGTTPKAENFSHFTYNNESIYFYFPVYQLGPRTLGEKKLAFPRALITKQEQKKERKIGMPNPASENCINKGGSLKIKKNAEGGEYGECTFPNGKVCEEWALYRGECSENL